MNGKIFVTFSSISLFSFSLFFLWSLQGWDKVRGLGGGGVTGGETALGVVITLQCPFPIPMLQGSQSGRPALEH